MQAIHDGSNAVEALLTAVFEQNLEQCREVLSLHATLGSESLHAAAVLGDVHSARRLIAEKPARMRERRGPAGGEPLLYLCYSPFHGESQARDAALLETARVLLAAGADPNTTDTRYGVAALYAVTAERAVLPLANLLLDAGANPNDGESMHHSAERYRMESMELLLARGCDINHVGDWGNTPLYFLVRWFPLDLAEKPLKGVEWLLGHAADPNVRCGPERQTALHAAAQRGQPVDVLKTLINHGARVDATRGDGATAWLLAKRSGFDEIASFLESQGAARQPLARLDELLRACAVGDVETAARLASPEFAPAIDALDESGATALHYAAFRGRPHEVRALMAAGADLTIRDRQHSATPLGWATWAAEYNPQPGANYPDAIAALSS